MHNSLLHLLLLVPLLAIPSAAKPHALLLPVRKDRATNQYITRTHQRTPLTLLNLVVDLGARYPWVDCDANYTSSSYHPVLCGSSPCTLIPTPFGCGGECFSPPRPGCNNNSCSVLTESPSVSTSGELAEDVLALQSTDAGAPLVSTPTFAFACGATFLLKGLAVGADGMAGLGRGRIGLPVQLAVAFGLPPKFALCLSSSTSSDGVIFFGGGPYMTTPLTYTQLIINRVSTAGAYAKGEKSVEYFIGVKSIKIGGKPVPSLNTALLSIDEHGNGGTKISTVDPYTKLETSIYKAVTAAFVAAMGRTTTARRVGAVGPFGVCYDGKGIGSTRVGPTVPEIDLVLESESVYWRILGANSMVMVRPGVVCLGFVDGGVGSRTSVVIGGHQIENNLLEFDLKSNRLGFSSSLLSKSTTCANFNPTSTALGLLSRLTIDEIDHVRAMRDVMTWNLNAGVEF